MLRQRPARRLTPLERRDRDLRACRRIHCHPRRSLGLRCILLQVGKTQFELLERGTAFRGLPVSLVLELGDRELHLLDQQLADADFGLGIARFRLRFQACDPRCDHHRLERCRRAENQLWAAQSDCTTDRKSCEIKSRADSQCRTQPAACGRHVCCGSRQSIPSSKYPSCAGLIVTVMSVPSRGRVEGQMKRPRSSRFANRHMP